MFANTQKNGWEVFFIYARQMTREKLFLSLSHSHWFHFHSFLHTLHALIFPSFFFFILTLQRNHAVRFIDFCVIRYTSKIPWKATQAAVIDGYSALLSFSIHCMIFRDRNELVVNFNPLRNFRSIKITFSLLTFGSRYEYLCCLTWLPFHHNFMSNFCAHRIELLHARKVYWTRIPLK